MKFILGEKIEMTQVFNEDGSVTPVTVIKAGPCKVTQVKNDETDGYQAVQVGFGYRKKITKPLKGHLKDLIDFRYLKEFRLAEEEKDLARGKILNVSIFQTGDLVKITGISKGKGFQGVVRRHGFHGSPATHGHKDQIRMPGSIGSTDSARVFKGTRMAGHMGDEQVTITNLEVVKTDLENNLLYIKGAVPGARTGLLLIQGPGELKVMEEIPETVVEPIQKTAEAVSSAEVATEVEPAGSQEEKPEVATKEVKEESKQTEPNPVDEDVQNDDKIANEAETK